MPRRPTAGIDHTLKAEIRVHREAQEGGRDFDGYTYRQASACIRLGKHRRVCGNGKGGDAADAIANALADLSESIRRHEYDKSEGR